MRPHHDNVMGAHLSENQALVVLARGTSPNYEVGSGRGHFHFLRAAGKAVYRRPGRTQRIAMSWPWFSSA